jgi:hypothetical protein
MSEYLAIKNWEEFQGTYTRSYIRDYTSQGSDEDYCKLTFFQRHVLQEVRRIRGRIGKNVPYDLHYICRESAATTPDKPRINAALTRLIHDGWLVVTNQEYEESKRPIKRVEEKRVEDKKPLPRSASADSIFERAYQQYPRHVAKRKAEQAWNAAVGRRKDKRTVPEAEDFIYQRVMTFAAVCQTHHKPREFIPHMATWLNQDRFMDDPSEWAVSANGDHGGKQSTLAKNLAILESID